MRRCIFFIFFFLTLANAQSFCDPELQIQENDPNAYQERDGSNANRCEGVYLQDVASSAASVTSFTTTYDFDEAAPSFYLSWPNTSTLSLTPTSKVRLRAESQVFKMYYRMDTVWPLPSDSVEQNVETSSFVWPTKIIQELQLKDPEDLGVAAWLPATFSDGVERDVYLPLSVSHNKNVFVMPSPSVDYAVVVMPSSELRAVNYNVFNTKDGYVSGEEAIVTGELDNDYFSSGQPLEINFTLDSDTAAVYYLEIEATRTNSKKSTLEVWFYHHGN